MPKLIVVGKNLEAAIELSRSFNIDATHSIEGFQGMKFRVFNTTSFKPELVTVSSSGEASFDEERMKESGFTVAQTKAIGGAFEKTLPQMEMVLGKDLRGQRHSVVIQVQSNEPEAGQNWSSPWHQDHGIENFTYMTSLIYFSHKNITSKLSFREDINGTLSNIHSSAQAGIPQVQMPVLYGVTTYTGCTVTFNNSVFEHRVHDVAAINYAESSHRYLLSFFYQGPFKVPSVISGDFVRDLRIPGLVETVAGDDGEKIKSSQPSQATVVQSSRVSVASLDRLRFFGRSDAGEQVIIDKKKNAPTLPCVIL